MASFLFLTCSSSIYFIFKHLNKSLSLNKTVTLCRFFSLFFC
ncbi:hypothetical protein OIU76_003136 [Salix suchowensis]|nr:hypothetical protein OIU76_003136 [Salix suchowensis]